MTLLDSSGFGVKLKVANYYHESVCLCKSAVLTKKRNLFILCIVQSMLDTVPYICADLEGATGLYRQIMPGISRSIKYLTGMEPLYSRLDYSERLTYVTRDHDLHTALLP